MPDVGVVVIAVAVAPAVVATLVAFRADTAERRRAPSAREP